jgi:DNA-directed RNA polymerase subunit RPC12/RpoP
MTIRTARLKAITAPATGYAIQAPPPIALSANTNHYLCGHCGTLLVIAVHGLVVRCRECDRIVFIPSH